jgi:hypothetical protein
VRWSKETRDWIDNHGKLGVRNRSQRGNERRGYGFGDEEKERVGVNTGLQIEAEKDRSSKANNQFIVGGSESE